MIYDFEALKQGYTIEADVVIVGSGAGGAVAATNFAAAGFKTVVVEAGPQVQAAAMTRDAPKFLAKHFWDGGLRMLLGTASAPAMQGRALGGSTVSNSAIMLKLPDWVRQEWIEKDGLTPLKSEAFDAAFERVFHNTQTAPTPLEVQGPRNISIRDALTAMGVESGPLPRAVKDCHGCADCLIGCASGAKQSVDRSYIPQAIRDGATVYTCSEVDKIIIQRGKAVGIEGHVVDHQTWERVAKFRVNAPRVIVAGGAIQTPVLLQKSGVKHRGAVGGTFAAHLSGGVMGMMPEPMHPWVGASQGWGAISQDIQGMKFESLWADPSVMLVKWGTYGEDYLRRLKDIDHLTIGAVVYRGRCRGSVRVWPTGTPRTTLWFPKSEAQTVFRGMKLMTDGLLKTGALSVNVGRLPGLRGDVRSLEDSELMLSSKLGGQHLPMTANHIFCSVRMTGDPKTPVDLHGRVRGVEGIWVADASVFPSPTAVNPQATVMALSDMITRQAAELSLV